MASETPLVSLLVPVYNVERYLDQCLASAAAQTLESREVICINDGSSDGSRAIIERYLRADPRFRVIDKDNSGYGDSMNRGLDAARGTYVGILESDDFLDPQALEEMVALAERDRLEVLKCNFYLHWSEPGPISQQRKDVYFPALRPDMIAAGVHRPISVPQIFWAKPSIWSALYRRDFLDSNAIRFLPTPGASYQDSSFTFKVFACATRVAYSGRAYLHYRQDNEGSSVNSKGKVYCTCDEHAEMSRFLDEDQPDLKAALDPIRAHVKYLNYQWNYDRLAEAFKKEFLDRFVAEMRAEVAAGTIDLHPEAHKMPGDLRQFQYFAPWELDELRRLLDDPAYYHARKTCERSPGKWETLRTYLSAGGPGFVRRALKDRRAGRG